MVYLPQWERLSDVLDRVMSAAKLSKIEAQATIGQAIADGAVKIRVKLREHTTKRMRDSTAVLKGEQLDIPIRINAEDLDWEGSRPVGAWTVRRATYPIPGPWLLESIELLRSDVTLFLCPAGTQGKSAQHASSKAGTKGKSRPSFDRARAAINEVYPEGVPGQAAEPNGILCWRVGQQLMKMGLPRVSDDTILRAAGRRR